VIGDPERAPDKTVEREDLFDVWPTGHSGKADLRGLVGHLRNLDAVFQFRL
jgi:hypothetical protein